MSLDAFHPKLGIIGKNVGNISQHGTGVVYLIKTAEDLAKTSFGSISIKWAAHAKLM